MGKMFTRQQILETLTTDGTYIYEQGYFVRVEHVSGYEIGYDEILNAGTEVEQAYFDDFDRIGRWTDGERVVFDRVIHVDAPQQIAEAIGREFDQQAIWAWEGEESINL